MIHTYIEMQITEGIKDIILRVVKQFFKQLRVSQK